MDLSSLKSLGKVAGLGSRWNDASFYTPAPAQPSETRPRQGVYRQLRRQATTKDR